MQTYKVVRTGRVSEPAVTYSSPQTIYAILANKMRTLDREHFMVLHLDSQHHLVGKETVSIGSLTQAICHPREIFKAAVINSSKAVILVHNHPSGNPKPSSDDIAITHRLKQAGEILGIEVLDHIIFGEYDYYSFVDATVSSKKARKGV